MIMPSKRGHNRCDMYSKNPVTTSSDSYNSSGKGLCYRSDSRYWKKIHRVFTDLIFAWRILMKVDKWYGCFLFRWLLKRYLGFAKPHDWEEKHECVKKILHNEFDDFLTAFVHDPVYEEKPSIHLMYEDCIWIYWDNVATMPAIVKSCISSVRRNSQGRKLVIVSENNIQDYITIEAHVMRKYKAGLISKTHFSDIVRISLLVKYGGLWMDATILQTATMPDYVTRGDFFTFKLDINKSWEVVSHGEWCVFFIACKKGNLLMKVTLDMMNAYWERYDLLIDYLLIDYLWMIASEKIPSIRKMLSEVPYTNSHLFSLRNLSMPCSNKDYLKVITHEDTCFYKMSYKGTVGVPLKDENGNLTLLGRIIENNR